MYITKGVLDNQSLIKAGIFDTYKGHKFVWKLFPGMKAREFLYRITDTPHESTFTVLSSTPPDTGLPGSWKTIEIPPKFYDYPRYVFNVRVNPTKRNPTTGCLECPKDLIAWFKDKAEREGLNIISFDVKAKDTFIIEKIPGKQERHMSADITGILEVTDTEAFKKVATKGFGRGRSFGFGLMILTPLK